MNRKLLFLVPLAVVLAVVLYIDREGASPQPQEPDLRASIDETSTKPSGEESGRSVNPLDDLAEESFAATLDQPLFNPGREPRAPEPPPPPPLAEEPPPPPPPPPSGPFAEDFALVAVSSGPTGRIAAVRVAATGELLYLREGQPVQSWTVIAVSDRSIKIGTPENNVEFTLFEGDGAQGADPMANQQFPSGSDIQQLPDPSAGGAGANQMPVPGAGGAVPDQMSYPDAPTVPDLLPGGPTMSGSPGQMPDPSTSGSSGPDPFDPAIQPSPEYDLNLDMERTLEQGQ